MTLKKTVNLMLKSSNYNPYTGMLSNKNNFIAAIDLAKLCKEFANNGQSDEAMNLDSNHWQLTINELQRLQSVS